MAVSTHTIQCSFLELTIRISGFSKFSFLCVAILCFKEFCFSFHRTKPFGDTALKIYTSPFSEVGKHTSVTLKCTLKVVSGSFMMFLDKIWSRQPVLECRKRTSFVKMDKVELWAVETWTKTKLRWSQKGSMLQHFKRCRTQFC